jgi:hypothetical protein
MPENSDDSKSFERTEKSVVSKASQNTNEGAKNVSKASLVVNEPKEIDFFDEKLDKASKEINKLAASQEYDDEYDAEYDEEQDVEIESIC